MSKTNKVIFAILSLVLLLVIYLLVTYKETTFNRVELVKINGVLNRTEQQFLDTIVHVGLKELNISGVTVLIEVIEEPIIFNEIEIQAYIVGNQNQFIIFTNKFSRKKAIEVISHELIHLNQYKTKELQKMSDTVVWKNVPYLFVSLIPYFDRPWEIEAFVLGADLERKVNKILVKK